MSTEIAVEPELLLRTKLGGMAAHEREQSAVATPFGVELLPGFEEVPEYCADHMEPVGDDPGIGKVFPDDSAVG